MNLFLCNIGSKRCIGYKNKSVEPYLCLFSITRFLQDPTDKNKQATPTPNMKFHQIEPSTKDALQGGIVTSQRAFTAFLFWVGEILQDFKRPKQALRTPHCLKLWGPRSKRFLYYVCKLFWFAPAKLQHFFHISK